MADDISIEVTGLNETRAKLQQIADKAPAVAHKVEWDGAMRLQQIVRDAASGHPGPEVRTGNYLRSIVVNAEDDGSVSVSSNSPYALRLEYGFMGLDSIGRHVSQAPRPHWAPAMQEFEPWFKQQVEAALNGLMQ